jgi:hypothetical protein
MSRAAVGAALVTLISLAGSAEPAGAKGAVALTISGPGIARDAPVEVSAETHPVEWERLDTGLWHAMPGETDAALTPLPDPAHLGPRHTLTWLMPTGPDETTTIRQDLYLYVEGAPLVYTAPGQPIWDGVTRGGWYRAPDRLRGVLADVCVPIIGRSDLSSTCWERRWAAKAEAATARAAKAEAVDAEAATATSPGAQGHPAAANAPSGDALWPEAIAATTALAAFVALTGVAAARRAQRDPRRPVAPAPR